MTKEFREFIARGNVLDLAIAVVIGAAFGRVIDSLVKDILMPPIGLLLGNMDFSNLYLNLSGETYASAAAAKEAGAAAIYVGRFINEIIGFIIVAFAVFLFIKQYNRLRRAKESAPVAEKECPHCRMNIPLSATRCAHCTSQLAA